MSDQSQGPGWWIASDGKWYPPDQAPAVPPPETWVAPPPGPPPSSGLSGGAKAAIAGLVVAGLLVVIGVGALFIGSEASSSSFESTGTAIDGEHDDEPSDGGGEPADLPEGWQELEGDGVSIGAPEGWFEVAPEDFAMPAEDFAEAFPGVPAEMVEQYTSMFEQGAVLLAFEPAVGDFAANVNILESPGIEDLGLIEEQAEFELDTVGAEDVVSEIVDLPQGDALRVEYTLEGLLPDGTSFGAEGVQYYLPLEGSTYVITVTALDDVAALADTMIDTFRTI